MAFRVKSQISLPGVQENIFFLVLTSGLLNSPRTWLFCCYFAVVFVVAFYLNIELDSLIVFSVTW